MTDHNKRLDLTAKEIEALSADAFAKLLERIRNGEDPQPAIQAIMNDFEPAYREVLAAAFTDTLARSVGAAELRDYPIGQTTLSRRLYAEATSTAQVVREIVRQHMTGFHDARALSMQIYEGYAFKTRAGLPDDPLQWPAASPKWPKYMRQAITQDPASFTDYRAIARKAAGNIKTPGYRAALNEALDALEKGKGEKVLARKLDVAYQERMRYHANRIAQTELHRAYMDKQAAEIMADDSVEVLKVVMSASHPRTDICDLFSKQDKYGLGPGLYPKESAPRPPFHPFCRCVLHSKRLLKAKDARENKASERQYLARVLREDGAAKAAQIIGGRAKLAAALTSAPIDAVVNIHRPVPYRLGRVGDNGLMDFSSFTGQRPDLRNLHALTVTELSGNEFGVGLSHSQLTSAANEHLRTMQHGQGLPNDDTGWALLVNKNGRKKMGDNEDQSDSELRAVAGIDALARRAVVGERHFDSEHKNPDVVAVFRMYAPVSIGGTVYRAKLTVKDYGGPKQLHALSAVEIENAPLGTLPVYSGAEALQQGQPTTGRTISITDLLDGATRNDGEKFSI